MHTILSPRIAAASLAGLLLLAGCSGATSTDETANPPSPSVTASQSTSTSPTAPTSAFSSASATETSSMQPLSELMTEPVPPSPQTQNDAGAMAFVWYYVDAADWSQATRDSSELKRICAPDNDQCNKVQQTAEFLAANDMIIYGGRSTLTVDGMMIASPDAETKQLQTRLLIEPLEAREAATGALYHSADAFDMIVNYTIKWTGSGWQMVSGVKVDS